MRITVSDKLHRCALVAGVLVAASCLHGCSDDEGDLTGPDGSWTILMTVPEGRACIVAVGEAWQPVPTTGREPLA